MKHSIIIRFAICIGFLMNVSLAYSQDEYEYLNTSSWEWSKNSNLKTYSNSTALLDVFNYKAQTDEDKRNNTWSSEKTWLSIPVIIGKAYTITFDVKNENNPKGYKYKVTGKDNYGRDIEVWHEDDIYWGLRFYAYRESQPSLEFEINYDNERKMNYSHTYTSYHTTVNKEWRPCPDIDKRKIRIEFDGNETVYIYEGNGDNLVKIFEHTLGISTIEVKCGNAARVIVSNFQMKRQTDLAVAPKTLERAIDLIEKKNYKQAIITLTQLIRCIEHPVPYYYRAKAYAGDESYKSAIEDCNNALKFQCDYKLKSDIHFVRGFCKIALNDDSGVNDMRMAGDRGLKFLRENGLLNYMPKQSKKATTTKSKSSNSGTVNRSTNRIPTLKKTN